MPPTLSTLKWSGMIETLQNDPDFTSIAHYGATRVMKQAHALATNGNGNGHAPVDAVFAARSTAAKQSWTPERRARQAARMRKDKPARKLTAAQRKVSADLLRKKLADPKFAAKRLKALRKALKAKKLAAKNGTPWQAKNAGRIARMKEQAAEAAPRA